MSELSTNISMPFGLAFAVSPFGHPRFLGSLRFTSTIDRIGALSRQASAPMLLFRRLGTIHRFSDPLRFSERCAPYTKTENGERLPCHKPSMDGRQFHPFSKARQGFQSRGTSARMRRTSRGSRKASYFGTLYILTLHPGAFSSLCLLTELSNNRLSGVPDRDLTQLYPESRNFRWLSASSASL